ncbi:MAG TPA: hypothetical protein VFP43_21865 [Mesorhizobium sp.]|nr:hypothetical protein [Mesorhizobium sp.]
MSAAAASVWIQQFAEVSDAYASQHVHCVLPVIEAEFSGDDGQTVTAFDVRGTEGIARPRQLRQETQSRDCIGLLSLHGAMEDSGVSSETIEGGCRMDLSHDSSPQLDAGPLPYIQLLMKKNHRSCGIDMSQGEKSFGG